MNDERSVKSCGSDNAKSPLKINADGDVDLHIDKIDKSEIPVDIPSPSMKTIQVATDYVHNDEFNDKLDEEESEYSLSVIS